MNRLAALALALALPVAGCAAVNDQHPEVVPPSPPIFARPAPPAGAARDSAPSPEALAVLTSIPEPLAAGETGGAAPAPQQKPPSERVPVVPAPPDTIAVSDSAAVAPPAEDRAPVPVPSRTIPLGENAVPAPAAPAAPPPLPAPAPSPASATPASAPAMPDTCWAVQVGAPLERARGSALRAASESLLMAPMTVVRAGGRWKVRTRDCLDRAAAESLKARALASGFRGVFLVKLPRGAR